MRLFVAIDLNDDARRAIAAEQKRLMEEVDGRGRSSLRWVRPAEMHLTLEFLGEVDQSRGEALIEAMRPEIEAPPFTMVCAGLGVFPPCGAPNVLWVGVATGSRDVIAVRGRILDRLTRVGIESERRAYHPHLTLARWRVSRPADRERVRAADRGAEVARVDVRAVTLYQSQWSSDGPRHTALTRAELRA